MNLKISSNKYNGGISEPEFKRLLLDDPEFAQILLDTGKYIAVDPLKAKANNKNKSPSSGQATKSNIKVKTQTQHKSTDPKSKPNPKSKPKPKPIIVHKGGKGKAVDPNDPKYKKCEDPKCKICEDNTKPKPNNTKPNNTSPPNAKPKNNNISVITDDLRDKMAKIIPKYNRMAYVYDWFISNQKGVTIEILKENIKYYEGKPNGK